MSKENQSEKIISDKLNSREFAFDEKAWADMETMLDAQENKRRVGFFWWFSASMFVAILAGAAWFFMPATNENENKTELATAANQTARLDNELATADHTLAMTANQSATTDNELATPHNQSASTHNQLARVNKQLAMAANQSAVADHELVTVANEATITQIESAATATELATTEIKLATISTEITTIENEQDSTKTTEQPLLTDSASLAETAKNPLTAPGQETKNAWGVMAGAGYWFPYQTTLGAPTNEGRFGFTGGIYYRRMLHKRWELGLSAIYSSRGVLDFDKTYTNTNYGFGIESDKTTVSPKMLHYLNIPFAIRFNATPRSHFYIGAAYYQLLATTSNVTRTIEDSFSSTVVSSEKQTGEHKGFRKNDVAAFIGYELTLFERMNLGLQVSYGFYDITNDSYQKYDDIIVKANDRNISLQLQLKYDLIRH